MSDAPKTTGSHGQPRTVIRGILLHLAKHPDAKDTFEGIFKFWLPKGAANQKRNKVREALDFLVFTKGWLTERKASTSEALYGLNKDHLEEIRDFLRESSDGN